MSYSKRKTKKTIQQMHQKMIEAAQNCDFLTVKQFYEEIQELKKKMNSRKRRKE